MSYRETSTDQYTGEYYKWVYFSEWSSDQTEIYHSDGVISIIQDNFNRQYDERTAQLENLRQNEMWLSSVDFVMNNNALIPYCSIVSTVRECWRAFRTMNPQILPLIAVQSASCPIKTSLKSIRLQWEKDLVTMQGRRLRFYVRRLVSSSFLYVGMCSVGESMYTTSFCRYTFKLLMAIE